MDKEILDVLAMVAGALLSVLVEIPAVKVWFDKLSDGQKRLVMAGLLILAGAAVFGLSCVGVLAVFFPTLALTCDTGGLFLLLRVIFFALISNQGVFSLAFRGRSKKAIRVS